MKKTAERRKRRGIFNRAAASPLPAISRALFSLFVDMNLNGLVWIRIRSVSL